MGPSQRLLIGGALSFWGPESIRISPELYGQALKFRKGRRKIFSSPATYLTEKVPPKTPEGIAPKHGPMNLQSSQHNPPSPPEGVAASIVASSRAWLRAVVYARLGDWEGVDDVLQEVALAALRQVNSPPPQWGPWLRRVAIRQALLFRRRLGRQRRRDKAANNSPTEGSANGRFLTPDPLEWLIRQEQTAQIQEAIRRLPPIDAELLLLKYGQDWSYGQIAEHLGVGINVIQMRLHRARCRLRQLISQRDLASSTIPPNGQSTKSYAIPAHCSNPKGLTTKDG